MPTFEINEDVQLANITAAIDGAFIAEDLYFRSIYLENLLNLKWMRAAILQSGIA